MVDVPACSKCGNECRAFLRGFICIACNHFQKPGKEKHRKQRTEGQKRSIKQEKRLANTFGGKRTLASGALWEKDDVVSDKVRVEAKSTRSDGYILHFEDLLELESHCQNMKIPIFSIHFHGREEFYILRGVDSPGKIDDWIDLPFKPKSLKLMYSRLPLGSNRLVISWGERNYVVINSKFVPDELLGEPDE